MDDELEGIEQEIEEIEQEIEHLEERLDELKEERLRIVGSLPAAARPDLLPETARNWWVASGSTTKGG